MKKTFLNFVFMFSLILSSIFIFCGCNSTIKEETKYMEEVSADLERGLYNRKLKMFRDSIERIGTK